MSHVWLTLPQDRSAYVALPTDYWPWTVAFADLEGRDNLSGALELRFEGRRARALWAEGVPLGGHYAGENVGAGGSADEGAGEGTEEDVAFDALAARWPRAELSLYLLDPAVARLAWQCRAAAERPAAGAWDALRGDLTRRAYSGVVRAAGGDSYWQGGARLGGPEPLPGERVSLLTPNRRDATAPEIAAFYGAALTLAGQRFAAEPHWRAACLDLADEHPCLDPFAREVVFERGALTVNQDVPAAELLLALPAAFAATAAHAGLRVADLPLEPLRAHPLWGLSLGELSLNEPGLNEPGLNEMGLGEAL